MADLRSATVRAVLPVRVASGLVAPHPAFDAAAGGGLPTAALTESVVVDRPTWVRANLDGFAVVLAPMLERMRESGNSGVAHAVGSRVTAVELGGVLAYLSGKVLGQFEAFVAPGVTPKLLLVAPNIVAAERILEVPPADFRLWVALHEETHRVQFGAVPWLADHLLGLIHSYLGTNAPGGDSVLRMRALLSGLLDVIRGVPGASIVDSVQSPAQREILDQVTTVMSVLEGHADHIMDEVGPEVVPSVALIRERFEARRSSASGLDGLGRRLLGMDAKLAQYRNGAAFVRGVEQLVGRNGFNAVWVKPENLPVPSELADPAAWVVRVHG